LKGNNWKAEEGSRSISTLWERRGGEKYEIFTKGKEGGRGGEVAKTSVVCFDKRYWGSGRREGKSGGISAGNGEWGEDLVSTNLGELTPATQHERKRSTTLEKKERLNNRAY